MGKRIGIDLDSTLNTLDVAWASWISRTFRIDFTVDKWSDWDVGSVSGIAPSAYDFLFMKGSFRNLGVQPGAHHALRRLRDAGKELFIVTHSHPNVIEEKWDWVERHFSDVFKASHLVTVADKSLVRMDVLIDDGMHNIEAFAEKNGGQAIIFDKPWNRKGPSNMDRIDRANGRVYRAAGWGEVEKILL